MTALDMNMSAERTEGSEIFVHAVPCRLIRWIRVVQVACQHDDWHIGHTSVNDDPCNVCEKRWAVVMLGNEAVEPFTDDRRELCHRPRSRSGSIPPRSNEEPHHVRKHLRQRPRCPGQQPNHLNQRTIARWHAIQLVGMTGLHEHHAGDQLGMEGGEGQSVDSAAGMTHHDHRCLIDAADDGRHRSGHAFGIQRCGRPAAPDAGSVPQDHPIPHGDGRSDQRPRFEWHAESGVEQDRWRTVAGSNDPHLAIADGHPNLESAPQLHGLSLSLLPASDPDPDRGLMNLRIAVQSQG